MTFPNFWERKFTRRVEFFITQSALTPLTTQTNPHFLTHGFPKLNLRYSYTYILYIPHTQCGLSFFSHVGDVPPTHPLRELLGNLHDNAV